MRSIAVINQKGGVGKTTTTAHLAAGLGLAGKRVLAIDLDPQAHLTVNFGAEPSGDGGGVYAVMTEGAAIAEQMTAVRSNVWLLPSHVDLAGAECELVSVVGREAILREAMAAVADRFDYVLIDCPPSLGILTVNALAAVGEVIIPLQPHFFALQGLGMLLNETIRLVGKRINPALRVTGIVVTMHEGGTRLASEVVADVKSFFGSNAEADCPWSDARVFDTVIRRNIKLAEAPGHGQTVFEYAPRSNGADDYRGLTGELLALHGAPDVARVDEPRIEDVVHPVGTADRAVEVAVNVVAAGRAVEAPPNVAAAVRAVDVVPDKRRAGSAKRAARSAKRAAPGGSASDAGRVPAVGTIKIAPPDAVDATAAPVDTPTDMAHIA